MSCGAALSMSSCRTFVTDVGSWITLTNTVVSSWLRERGINLAHGSEHISQGKGGTQVVEEAGGMEEISSFRSYNLGANKSRSGSDGESWRRQTHSDPNQRKIRSARDEEVTSQLKKLQEAVTENKGDGGMPPKKALVFVGDVSENKGGSSVATTPMQIQSEGGVRWSFGNCALRGE